MGLYFISPGYCCITWENWYYLADLALESSDAIRLTGEGRDRTDDDLPQ
jgi:hypothetical protein